MKNLVLAITIALSMSACLPMSDDRATRALESQGYTDVSITGVAVFGCSEDDVFRSNFTAKGRDGKPVTGTVCGGLLKGTTVRID